MAFGAALMMSALVGGLGFAQTPSLEGTSLTIRGCVRTGVRPGMFVLHPVAEVHPDGKVIVPTNLARPVLYWLDDISGLRSHVGRTVDVSGTIKDVREYEAEVRADAAHKGGMIVELEGPGRDVEASVDAIPGVVGTSGTLPASDVKTVVLEIDVASVTPRSGQCR